MRQQPLVSCYPHKCLSKMMWRHAKGTLSDLEVLVGVAIDPRDNNNCLTRLSNGMF